MADAEPPSASPNPASPVLKLFSPNQDDELAVAEVAEQPLDAADFIAQLEDTDEQVRWRAFQSLQGLGASAVPELLASLNHRNPAVRKSVIMVLGQIGDEARSAMPAMLVALHDINADVRGAAADCLGRLGVVNGSMLQMLVKTLSDPNAEVRRYAATTLGRVGPQARTAITALQIASISDIAAKVRSAAQAALQRISKPHVEAA
jgi:HEAT repeat protein